MSWPRRALGEICEIRSGVGFPKTLQGSEQGELPVFKVGDISRAWLAGQPTLQTAQHYVSLDQARQMGATPLPAGAIVFAKIGEGLKLNRRAKLGSPAIVDNNVMGLVPRSSAISSDFLFHFFRTVDLGVISQATAVPSVRKSDIALLQMPVPSREEQAHVVEFIEQHESRIDAAAFALDRTAAGLRRYRIAALKSAVQEAMAWPQVALGSVTESLDARRVPVNAAHRAERVGEVPYYGATGQVGWIDDHLFDEELVLLGEDGAPFLEPDRPKAYRILGKSWVNNHAHVLRPFRDAISPGWLETMLNAADYRDLVTGTTRLKLTKSAMNRLQIRLPPPGEQRRLLASADRRISIAGSVNHDVQHAVAASRGLRRAILERAFSSRSSP